MKDKDLNQLYNLTVQFYNEFGIGDRKAKRVAGDFLNLLLLRDEEIKEEKKNGTRISVTTQGPGRSLRSRSSAFASSERRKNVRRNDETSADVPGQARGKERGKMTFRHTSEVEMMINKAVESAQEEGLKAFINNNDELIVIPKINAYFSLKGVNTAIDFECSIISSLSYLCASNHWNRYWSPRMTAFINIMLGTRWDAETFDDIYAVLGNGINHDVCLEFVKSGYCMAIIENDDG